MKITGTLLFLFREINGAASCSFKSGLTMTQQPNIDDPTAKILIEDDCTNVIRYNGCYQYKQTRALMDNEWTFTSPFGPEPGSFSNPKISSDNCWANDDTGRSNYEVDGVTCKSY